MMANEEMKQLRASPSMQKSYARDHVDLIAGVEATVGEHAKAIRQLLARLWVQR
jgi:hypothetical protein